MEKRHQFLLLLLTLFQAFFPARAQSFIGVNYGEVADNLPPPEATVRLLQYTTISKLRLYGADPGIIRALAGTSISIVVGTVNSDIPNFASDPSAASSWAAANVLPYLPASSISLVSVGNEALNSGDPSLVSQLLPAMQNLRSALASSAPNVKVSTVHSMAVLAQSDPPSSGAFHQDLAPTLAGILGFLRETGSPFMINPYPYFAYKSDPRPETLSFCLFEPNAGRVDSKSGITYMNMFDAQLDAIRSALNAAGFSDVEIVVAETGWPYRGDPDEVGATVEDAKAYNGNLIAHLRSLVGTPLMPGKSVDTYLFALYDEDLKPGATSERSFGLFRPDLTMTYDVGLSKSSSAPAPVSPANLAPVEADKPNTWCVPSLGATQPQLQANLNYTCSPGVDCSSIHPGGNCFVPNIVASHAAYTVNLLYQVTGRNPWNCNFRQTTVLASNDPSSLTNPQKYIDQRLGLRTVLSFTLHFLFSFALPSVLVLTW